MFGFSFRKIIADSGDIGDSLIVLVDKKIDKDELSRLINEYSLPIKNIPDAIRWHYAGFWQHLLGEHSPNDYQVSENYLSNSIAISINVFSSNEVENRVFDFFSTLKAL